MRQCQVLILNPLHACVVSCSMASYGSALAILSSIQWVLIRTPALVGKQLGALGRKLGALDVNNRFHLLLPNQYEADNRVGLWL
jgi:hypothetical protein